MTSQNNNQNNQNNNTNTNQNNNTNTNNQKISKSWIIARDFNQISSASVTTINGILAAILTLLSGLNTDPNIQKTMAIAFGTTITILNLVIHIVLQIMIVVNSTNNQQEQAEEAFVNDAQIV